VLALLKVRRVYDEPVGKCKRIRWGGLYIETDLEVSIDMD
jgi:hypothetical protein